MRTATTIVRTLIRLTGLVQIVLGVLFWTGNARGLIPLHMLVGFVLVLSLWVMAALAARAGVQPGLVALAAVWGLVVPVLGLAQDRLLPGSAHWLIQVLHLLVGLAAIGQGESLAARILRRPVPSPQP
ncbi:MAG TPA: hypothetical protein VG276_04015 [Actinomycetes bacterium]|nr:hypothetical protein [Actinomycetes bacterium]